MGRLARFIRFYTEEDDGNGGETGILKTITGNLLHLTDALAKPVKKFTATLEPQQDLHGQANPYPAGGGKNKFDIAKMGERTGVTVTDNTFVGTARNFTASGLVTPFSAPTGTVLTVSCTAKSDGVATSGAGFALVFVYSDNTTLRPWYTNNNETSDTYHTGTVTAASDIVGYKFADYNNGTENTWTVKNFQVEIGSTATSYAPYSNICPITGYTGANVTRTGKNLCYKTLNGYVSIGTTNAVYYASNDTRSLVFKCKAGVTYMASGITTNRFIWGVFDSEPTSGTSTLFYNSEGNSPVPFTPTKDGICVLYVSNVATDTSTAQIEVGSTTSTYEEYQGTTYPITFPAAAGTVYGGTLENQGTDEWVLTVDRAMESFLWSNCQLPTVLGSYERRYFTPSNQVVDVASVPEPDVSNVAPMAVDWTGDFLHFYSNSQYNRLFFYLPTNLDGSTQIQACYHLATPVTYTLTNQQAMTLLAGENNIWADCSDDLELTYLARA